MFSGIRKRWQEARGAGLLEEVEEVIHRAAGYPPDVAIEFANGYIGASAIVDKNYGNVTHLSNDRRKRISQELKNAAKKSFHQNVGRSNGMFMVAAKLEAMSLPGEAAQSVLGYISGMEEMVEELTKEPPAEFRD